MMLWFGLAAAPPTFSLEAPELELRVVHGVRMVHLPGPFRLITPGWTLSASAGIYVESGGLHEAWGGVRFQDTLRTLMARNLLLVPDRDTFTVFRDSVRYRDSTTELHTDCLVMAGGEARFSPVDLVVPDEKARVRGREGWLVDGGVYVWGVPLPELALASGEDTLRVVAGILRLEEGRVFADSAVDVIHTAYRARGVSLIYRPASGEGELLGVPAVLVYGGGEVTGRWIRFVLKDGQVKQVQVEQKATLEQVHLKLQADTLVAFFAGDSGRVVRVEAHGRVEGVWEGPETDHGGAESP